MADNQRFAQLQTFRLAGASSVIGDTTLVLSSFQSIDGSNLAMTDFGTFGYGTIQPDGGEFEEQIRFTGITQNANGTATLTGVSSVGFLYPYTITPNITKLHPGGASFVISNTAKFYDGLVAKDNDETIVGIYTFTNPNVPRMDVQPSYLAGTELYFATKFYVDSVAFAGAPNASTTQKGIVEIATDIENGAGTGTGGTGAILVAASSSHNYISALNKIPVGRASDGKIDNSWGGGASSLATLNASSLVVQNPAIATTTPTVGSIPVTTGASITLDRGWIPFRFGGTGADGALTVTVNTAIDLGGSDVFIKNYSSISITGGTLSFTNPATTGTVIIFRCSGDVTITSAATPSIDLKNGGSTAGTGGVAGAGNNGTIATRWIAGQVGGGGGGAAGGAGVDGAGGAGGSSAFNTGTAGTNSGGGPVGGVVGASPFFSSSTAPFILAYPRPGAGGGGGGSGDNGGANGAAGGRGAASLYIEVKGSLNFTGSIDASGTAGSGGTLSGANYSGSGGGGGAGSVVIMANTITANTGTISIGGGAGGTSLGTGSGGAGATGFSYSGLNISF